MDKPDQEKPLQWYENAESPATKNIAFNWHYNIEFLGTFSNYVLVISSYFLFLLHIYRVDRKKSTSTVGE